MQAHLFDARTSQTNRYTNRVAKFSGVLKICPYWILTDSPEWKETQWQANFFSTEITWKEIVYEKGVEKKQNLQ